MSKVVLQIKCPDQSGIIARYTGLLFEYKANVLNLEQHVEPQEGLFYMRIFVDLSELVIDVNELMAKLDGLSDDLGAKIRNFDPSIAMKVAVFATKEQGPVYDLLMNYRSGDLPCEIVCIVSNHNDLVGIAEDFNVPFHYIPISKDTKAEQEKKMLELLNGYDVDLVVLARYMQILSKDFVDEYHARIINIHHGFLPAFKGQKPYHQAWERGVKMIGATAHYVTEDLDEGPIIEQDVISVSHQHSAKEMVQAGRDIERRVLTSAVKAHLEHRIILHGKRTIIFHP
jgi:formyltetrahydrofolate deformylase